MNRPWSIVLLALVFAGLAAYVYWIELPTEQAKTKTEEEQKKLLLIEERDLTEIRVRSNEQEVVMVPDRPRRWNLTAPIQTPADQREVDDLLRALVLGQVSRVVAEHPTSLEPFGLAKPATIITLTAGARRETISIGDSGPISSTLYALRESDRRVLLTTLAPKDVLNKTLHGFRKKEILAVDQAQTAQLRLTYQTGELLLVRREDPVKDRSPSVTSKKHWELRFPIEAAADQAEVNKLLIRLEDMKATGFIDPGKDYDALWARLVRPDVKVTALVAGSEQTVKLFQLDPKSGEAFAVTTKEHPIYRIPPGIIKDLTKDVFTVQDKRLLGADTDDIARLTVKTRDDRYVLVHQRHEWVIEDRPAEHLNQETVKLFVDRIAGLPAEIRVLKQAGQLASYGLASPYAEFVATGTSGKQIGKLALGTSANGLIYAMGQGLPGIYQARADIVSQIPDKRSLAAAGAGETPKP
jgi:hypothetical protein